MFYIGIFYWLGYRTRSVSVAYEYFECGVYDFCAILMSFRNSRIRCTNRSGVAVIDMEHKFIECIHQLGPENLRQKYTAHEN
jgi:hypothetical protein